MFDLRPGLQKTARRAEFISPPRKRWVNVPNESEPRRGDTRRTEKISSEIRNKKRLQWKLLRATSYTPLAVAPSQAFPGPRSCLPGNNWRVRNPAPVRARR